MCNMGTFKVASAGVRMPPNAVRMTRLTFSSLEYGSDVSFTFTVLIERTGSVYLEEERCQTHGISLRNPQERQRGKKLILPLKML